MKILNPTALLATLFFFAATPTRADIVWVGGVSNDIFDESNWDLSGSSVTVVDPNVTIADDVCIVDAALPVEIPDLAGQIRFQVGDGFTLLVDNSVLNALGNDGVGGMPGSQSGPLLRVIDGGGTGLFFITNSTHLDLDATSAATFGGPNTPINGSTVDLTYGATLTFTDETVADFIAEHLSKVTVDGAPAVIGNNLQVVSDGAMGSIVTVIPNLGDSYCLSVTNSTGGSSTISATGSASISANDLVLAADSLPAQPGIFIAGPGQTQVPFFNGFLCVDPNGLQRFLNTNAPTGGVISEAVDYASAAAGGLNVVAGSSYNYQRWNRDPAGGGANATFSDGFEIVHTP